MELAPSRQEALPWRLARTPRWQALALFCLTLSLHLYDLNDRPGFPHFFEDNMLTRELRPGLTPRQALTQPWPVPYEILREWGNGDVDHVGFSWPWVLVIHVSRTLLGETTFAHRLPSAVICSFSPVLLFFFVRRFFRPELAFPSALLLATSPLHLMFGRNGGYVGPNVALIIGLMFLSLKISIEDNRRAWIGLTLLLLLIPYAYAPSRYLGPLTLVPIFYAMLRKPGFFRGHAPFLAGAALLWLVCAIPNVAAKQAYMHDWGKATLHAAEMFYNGSGEYIVTAERPEQRRILLHEVGRIETDDGINYESTHEVLQNLVRLRLKQWWRAYWLGELMEPTPSWTPPARYALARFYPPLIVPALWAIGVIYCTWRSLRERRPRELLIVAWSMGTWVPLLITTQVNGNRTVVGLPADFYLILSCLTWLMALLRTRVGIPQRSLNITAGVALVVWAAAQVRHYFGALP